MAKSITRATTRSTTRSTIGLMAMSKKDYAGYKVDDKIDDKIDTRDDKIM